MYEKDFLCFGQAYQSCNVFVCSVSDVPLAGAGDHSGADSDLSADVSGNDPVMAYYPSSVPVFPEDALQNTYVFETYTVSDPDLEAGTLEIIDNKLTIIIFLMLFIWCAHHIRNAVRSFTRRRFED